MLTKWMVIPRVQPVSWANHSQSEGRKLSGIGDSPSVERRSAQCMDSTPPILAKSVRKAGSWSLATIFVSATAAARSSDAAYCKTSVSLASFGGGYIAAYSFHVFGALACP